MSNLRARTFTGHILWVGLALALATPLAAQGKGLSASAGHDLTFGALFPGVATTIQPLDAVNAGRFDIRGNKQAEVDIELTLPAALVSGGGAQLPLTFGPADGSYSQTPNANGATLFDPRVPLVTRLGNSGRVYVYLGGTATPGGQQKSGAYSATITLTVAYTGN